MVCLFFIAVDQKVVEPTIKRSKSSEVLSSEAASAVSTPQHQQQAQDANELTRADLKTFWQKRQSVKSTEKKQGTQKLVPETSSKASNKEIKSEQKVKTVPPVSAKPPPSPKRSASPACREPPALSKLSPLRHTIPKPQQKESPSKPTPASPKEKKNAKKLGSNSPRLSRLLQGSRARSESPERMAQKPSPKVPKKHQLQTSSSLKSLDKEVEKEDSQTNVHDIIKKYDLRTESVTSKPVQSGTQPSMKSQKEPGKKDSKKAAPSKGKKSKDESKSTKESKGGFFSFFKRGKSYDVAGASSKDKAKKPSTPSLDQTEQSNVKKKIGQLKEIGLMTDGCEENDAVLLSVSPIDDQPVDEDNTIMNNAEDCNPLSNEEPETSVTSVTSVIDEPTRPTDELVSNGDASQMIQDTEEDEAMIEEGADRVKALKAIFSPKHPVVSRHYSIDNKR